MRNDPSAVATNHDVAAAVQAAIHEYHAKNGRKASEPGDLSLGYGGARVNVRGLVGIVGLVVVLLAGSLGGGLWIVKNGFAAMVDGHERQERSTAILACMVGLSPERRERMVQATTAAAFYAECPFLGTVLR